jgi:hypothetical protein
MIDKIIDISVIDHLVVFSLFIEDNEIICVFINLLDIKRCHGHMIYIIYQK